MMMFNHGHTICINQCLCLPKAELKTKNCQKLNQTAAVLSFGWVFIFQLENKCPISREKPCMATYFELSLHLDHIWGTTPGTIGVGSGSRLLKDMFKIGTACKKKLNILSSRNNLQIAPSAILQSDFKSSKDEKLFCSIFSLISHVSEFCTKCPPPPAFCAIFRSILYEIPSLFWILYLEYNLCKIKK